MIQKFRKKNLPLETPPVTPAAQTDVKKKKKPVPSSEGWVTIRSAITVFTLIGIASFCVIYIPLKRQRCVFDNVGISESFRQRGYTDGFIINTVNHIISRISSYEGELRNISYGTGQDKANKSPDGTPKKVSGFTGYQLASISNLNIQGIPFKTLIYIADKILGSMMDLDNYVTMEFYQAGSRLNLAVQFNDKRQVFSTPYHEERQEDAIYQLCYKAAIFLMEETDPIRLAEYYFASDQYSESIKACIYTIQKDESAVNKSRAYYIWGLSTSVHEDADVAPQIRAAVRLDPGNHLAAIGAMGPQAPDSVVQFKIEELTRQHPDITAIWYNWVDRINPENPSDSASMTAAYARFMEVYNRFISVNREKVPSEVHWYFGKKLESWGKFRPQYLDSALRCYKKALDHETQRADQSMYKISEYYNAIGYTYQQKAFYAVCLSIDGCLTLPIQDQATFESILEYSHEFAHLAVLADSLNPWAWSTLGEYYGLMHMLYKNDVYLERSLSALTRSYQSGLDIDQYVGGSEPYCYIYRNYPRRYEALKRNTRYFQGPMRQLRKLRLWETG
jgi:hypothetical protein